MNTTPEPAAARTAYWGYPLVRHPPAWLLRPATAAEVLAYGLRFGDVLDRFTDPPAVVRYQCPTPQPS